MQKSTLFSVHLLGAAVTFVLGMLYILVESGVSYLMQPHIHGKTVFLVRLAMGLWSLASIIISILPERSSDAAEQEDLPVITVMSTACKAGGRSPSYWLKLEAD